MKRACANLFVEQTSRHGIKMAGAGQSDRGPVMKGFVTKLSSRA